MKEYILPYVQAVINHRHKITLKLTRDTGLCRNEQERFATATAR